MSSLLKCENLKVPRFTSWWAFSNISPHYISITFFPLHFKCNYICHNLSGFTARSRLPVDETPGLILHIYATSHWEMTLQCNIVSHWLGTYTNWSLRHLDFFSVLIIHWLVKYFLWLYRFWQVLLHDGNSQRKGHYSASLWFTVWTNERLHGQPTLFQSWGVLHGNLQWESTRSAGPKGVSVEFLVTIFFVFFDISEPPKSPPKKERHIYCQ